jgi:SAM-dependent methyltransferase
MLEKAKARNIFDLLTRTDLANPATYPQARFTAVVCADVLVYFGDLEPVLRNFAAVMQPGGWLILTVEDAAGQGQARGWEHRPSGRYRHDPHYVVQALAGAGFTQARMRDPRHPALRVPHADRRLLRGGAQSRRRVMTQVRAPCRPHRNRNRNRYRNPIPLSSLDKGRAEGR